MICRVEELEEGVLQLGGRVGVEDTIAVAIVSGLEVCQDALLEPQRERAAGLKGRPARQALHEPGDCAIQHQIGLMLQALCGASG